MCWRRRQQLMRLVAQKVLRVARLQMELHLLPRKAERRQPQHPLSGTNRATTALLQVIRRVLLLVRLLRHEDPASAAAEFKKPPPPPPLRRRPWWRTWHISAHCRRSVAVAPRLLQPPLFPPPSAHHSPPPPGYRRSRAAAAGIRLPSWPGRVARPGVVA
jgi:hypothetical protein